MVVESLVDSLQLAGKGEAVLETELPLPLAARRTILVVDADAAILQEFSELLTHRDIHILFASGAEDALRQASDFIFKIDLLVSDFQMSGMTGIDLAAEMSRERPELKVLSLFTDGLLVLNGEWRFRDMPFTSSELRTLILDLVLVDGAERCSTSSSEWTNFYGRPN
jgi:DNA-binding NtrC family response regulator